MAEETKPTEGQGQEQQGQQQDVESRIRGLAKELEKAKAENARILAAQNEAAKKAEEEKARAAGELDKVLASTKAELQAQIAKAARLERENVLALRGIGGVLSKGLLAEYADTADAPEFAEWLEDRVKGEDVASYLTPSAPQEPQRKATPPMVGGGVPPRGAQARSQEQVISELKDAIRRGDRVKAAQLEAEARAGK